MIGGMIIGTRKEIIDQKEQEKKEMKGIITGEFKYKGDKLRIVGIYSNGDMETKLESLEKWMEDREEGRRTIIGGNFNARTEKERGRINKEEEKKEIGKISKDGKINAERKN